MEFPWKGRCDNRGARRLMADLDASSHPARIGPYELLTPLGSGGMATVYRAHDARLGRDVAVKLVRLASGDEAARRERLAREARAAGRIRHPHVIAVLDVSVDGEHPYLVTELVEGVPLRTLLTGRPMPVERALDLATQIVDGLVAAHDAGVIHRDLKPENVMVGRDGRAILVDFGLAKADEARGDEAVGVSTLTAPHTVLGTVNYMSPEQARGAAVDARSDQFAFGVVFYEMLSGRRAFERPSSVETLAAILKDEPAPLESIRDDVALPLRWIVARCLAKSSEERYAATPDLLFDLRAAQARAQEVVRQGSPAQVPAWRRLAGAAALATLVPLGWLAADRFPKAPLEMPRWRRLSYDQGFVDSARFTRDGETVIYSASWRNQPFSVFSTTLSSPESRALDVPAAGVLAVAPSGEVALSQDCTYIAASGLCAGMLSRVPLLGGAPKPIATDVRSADWGPDGSLAISRRSGGDFNSVDYPLGTRLSDRGTGYVRVSPDGTRVAWGEALDTNVQAVVVLDGGQRREVTSGWRFISGLAWTRGGDALLVSGVGPDSVDDAVVRVSLDGSSRIVLRGIARLRVLDAGIGDRLLVGVSSTMARLWVWPTSVGAPRDLTWLDNAYLDAVSPTGDRVLFTVRAGASLEFQQDLYPIFVRDTAAGPATRIGTGYGLALSADGRWALTRTRPETGAPDLIVIPLGPGNAKRLPRGGVDVGAANSLADFAGADRVIMRAREDGGPWRTYVQSLDGGVPVPIAHEPGEIVSPIAPDGSRFVARRNDGSLWVAHSTIPAPAVRIELPRSSRILQWTSDGRGLILASDGGLRRAIGRFDLTTGRVTPIREVGAVGNAGVEDLRGLAASRDATVVGLSELRTIGALYVTNALRP